MVETGEDVPASTYLRALGESPELDAATKRLGLPDRPEAKASVIEFILEGLHLSKRLNKDEMDGRSLYRR
jgi:magnesium chelatase subunit I